MDYRDFLDQADQEIKKSDWYGFKPSSWPWWFAPYDSKDRRREEVAKQLYEDWKNDQHSAQSQQSSSYFDFYERALADARQDAQTAFEASRASAREATLASQQEAQRNRDWMEQMSNTAYQRAMADMRSAGLNPILAYSQGGASVPSASSAQSFSASMSTPNYSYSGLSEGYATDVNSATALQAGILQLIGAIGKSVLDNMPSKSTVYTKRKR